MEDDFIWGSEAGRGEMIGLGYLLRVESPHYLLTSQGRLPGFHLMGKTTVNNELMRLLHVHYFTTDGCE